MRKVSLVSLMVFFVIGFLGGHALAKDTQNNGKPFQEIWDAIENVELAPGPPGPPGPEGPQGPQGESGGIVAVSHDIDLDTGWSANAVKMCPQGTYAIGGSCWLDHDPVANGTVIIYDGPWHGHESWNCYVSNANGAGTIVLTTTTICKELP